MYSLWNGCWLSVPLYFALKGYLSYLFQEVDEDPGQATSPYFNYLPYNSLTPLETIVTINYLKKLLFFTVLKMEKNCSKPD